MQKKYAKETWVGIFVLIGLLCVAYLTVQLGRMELLGGNYYTLTAKFTNISGLTSGASVEIAGVRVGQVTDISLDTTYGLAVVDMQIEKNVPLAADSIASIKTSGLIGDKYVKISMGGAPETLEDGGTITETESALDIESLISKYAFGSVEEE
jgi:phospholipid/cholesterol/gamma-HCH transport system substrate-binding protein